MFLTWLDNLFMAKGLDSLAESAGDVGLTSGDILLVKAGHPVHLDRFQLTNIQKLTGIRWKLLNFLQHSWEQLNVTPDEADFLVRQVRRGEGRSHGSQASAATVDLAEGDFYGLLKSYRNNQGRFHTCSVCGTIYSSRMSICPNCGDGDGRLY
jgi:hypothetical protein